MQKLSDLNYCVFTPQTNFVLFKLLSASFLDSGIIFQRLLKHGVTIQHLTNYGLSRHLHVSVGAPLENRYFLDQLKEVLDNV
ncbi:hypothetical protein DSUL_60257 [Desulfovibrionales bacterium]